MTTSNEADPAGSAPHTPDLVPAAQGAFRGLFWAGLVMLGIGVIALGVGMTSDGYGEEGRRLGGYALAGFSLLPAAVFFAASGIVAGLGARLPE